MTWTPSGRKGATGHCYVPQWSLTALCAVRQTLPRALSCYSYHAHFIFRVLKQLGRRPSSDCDAERYAIVWKLTVYTTVISWWGTNSVIPKAPFNTHGSASIPGLPACSKCSKRRYKPEGWALCSDEANGFFNGPNPFSRIWPWGRLSLARNVPVSKVRPTTVRLKVSRSHLRADCLESEGASTSQNRLGFHGMLNALWLFKMWHAIEILYALFHTVSVDTAPTAGN
jgi:hypothetical protein